MEVWAVAKSRVADKADLKPGTMMRAEAGGKELVIANVEGQFYAMDGRCSHMQGELWKGRLTGFVVRCPRHGTEYDIRTGAVISNVKIPLIGKAVALKAYPVEIEGNDVLVDF